MSNSKTEPITILAAIDYSETSSLVVERALGMSYQKQLVELHFLHVNQRSPDNEPEQGALRAELHEWLSEQLRGDNGLSFATKIVSHEASGDPAHVIVDMASALLADLVIVGTHGRKGVERIFMGSVSESVLRNSVCPVLVVRPKGYSQPFPTFAPPCARCVAARVETGGAQFWCDQHGEKHGRRHTYYDSRQSSWVTQRMMP